MTETALQINTLDEQTTPARHDDRLDFLRALASFGVVLLHMAGPIVSGYSGVVTQNWWFSNVINSMVRWSVPVFFMISGYLYLKDVRCYPVFFLKKLTRVGLPLLFWSVFFVCLSVYYEGERIGFFYFVRTFVLGSCYFHLWFLYALIGLIISVPILYAFWEKFDDRGVKYYLIIWFIVTSVSPFINKLLLVVKGTELVSYFDFSIFLGYSGFFFLGALLGKIRFTTRQAGIAFFGFAVAGFLTLYGTYWVSSLSKEFNPTFYSYTSPTTVIMACSIYIVILRMAQSIVSTEKLKWLVPFYHFLGKTSFGVYLMHPAWIRLFRDIGLAPTRIEDVGVFYFGFKFIFSAICIYLFSIATAAAFSKIPLLNKVV